MWSFSPTLQSLTVNRLTAGSILRNGQTAVDAFTISFDLVEVCRTLSLFCIFSYEQHRLNKITALEFKEKSHFNINVS